MTRRPTIVDVAQAAGVSKSTVSLVLRDSPLVREGTRAAVRAAMARTGYVYNRAAANLRGTGTGLIGLIINDLRNPFFTEFATAVQMALSARGHAGSPVRWPSASARARRGDPPQTAMCQ